MLVRRQNLRRVSDCDPTDRDRRVRPQYAPDMNYSIDSHLGLFSDSGSVEYRNAGGKKSFILDSTTIQICSTLDAPNARHHPSETSAEDFKLSDDIHTDTDSGRVHAR